MSLVLVYEYPEGTDVLLEEAIDAAMTGKPLPAGVVVYAAIREDADRVLSVFKKEMQ